MHESPWNEGGRMDFIDGLGAGGLGMEGLSGEGRRRETGLKERI